MKPSLSFRNARIVRPAEVFLGSLSVSDGRISDFDNGGVSCASAIDLEGDYLMPGLVELHTDNFERHLMPRPKVQWAEMPALIAHDAEIAAAGITTVFDALGVGESDPESVRASTWQTTLNVLQSCKDQNLLRADHQIHVRCELPAPNTIELFEPFQREGHLSMLSLMDHTPGQRQWENIDKARIYYTGKKGWTLEKFESQVARSQDLQQKFTTPHRRFFVDYCNSHGIAMASHDDTTETHVEQAHEEGVRMSEFPTTVKAARAARAYGMANIMGGPNLVRGGSHSGNVAAQELARLGLLDIVSSDYVPASLIGSVMQLVKHGLFTLPQAVATVTVNPARATGLHDRGAIESGLRADLIQLRMVMLGDGSRHPIIKAVWREGRQVL